MEPIVEPKLSRLIFIAIFFPLFCDFVFYKQTNKNKGRTDGGGTRPTAIGPRVGRRRPRPHLPAPTGRSAA